MNDNDNDDDDDLLERVIFLFLINVRLIQQSTTVKLFFHITCFKIHLMNIFYYLMKEINIVDEGILSLKILFHFLGILLL